MGGRRQRAFANRPSHTSIAHAISSPPSYPNPPVIPAPPPRHSCAGRNPPSHLPSPFPNSSLPPSRGEVRWGVGGNERLPTARLNTPTARPSRLCAAAGGSEPKTRVAYRVGSCLRRNDEKGRRNDGGAGRGAIETGTTGGVCAGLPPPLTSPLEGGRDELGKRWAGGGGCWLGGGRSAMPAASAAELRSTLW